MSVGLVAGVFSCRHAGLALARTMPLEDPDAIVVLASHERQRLATARVVAARFPAARVILTTPSHPLEMQAPQGDGRVEWLARQGIPEARITVLPQIVDSTFDEARVCLAESRRVPIHRLLIVSSPYHGRRALAAFGHVFRDSDVAIGFLPAASSVQPGRWWMRRYDRLYVAYEWSAILWYALRFGVIP